jgi:hypothetical protein
MRQNSERKRRGVRLRLWNGIDAPSLGLEEKSWSLRLGKDGRAKKKRLSEAFFLTVAGQRRTFTGLQSFTERFL